MNTPELAGMAVSDEKQLETDILIPAGWPSDPAKKLVERAGVMLFRQSFRRLGQKDQRAQSKDGAPT